MRYLRNLAGKLPRLLALVILAAAFWIATGGQLRPPPKPATDIASVPLDRVKYLFPQALSVERMEDPSQASPVKDASGTLLGYLLATSPYSDKFIGYGGTIPLLIALDTNMQVTGLHLLANRETPSFIEGIAEEGLFDQWTGLAPREAAEKQVDAITEATLSSNAVIHGVSARLQLLSSGQEAATGIALKDLLGWSAAALLLLFSLASFFRPARFKKYRPYLLGANVIILGFYLGSFLSLSMFGNWLHNGVAWWVTPVSAALGLLGLLLPAVTNKSYYCIYVCPYGALQELAGMPLKGRFKIPARVERWLRHGPKLWLTLALASLALGAGFDLADVEPFAAFLISSASAVVLVLAGTFLVLSFIVPRPWCRYGCPTGELVEIFRRPASSGLEPTTVQRPVPPSGNPPTVTKVNSPSGCNQ